MIRVIAMDLDDTLIAPDQQIPEENLQMIRTAREAGVRIVFATARGWYRTESLYRALDLDTPAIVSSGAQMIDGVTGEELWGRTIPLELAKEVIAFANEQAIALRVYVGSELWNNLPRDPIFAKGQYELKYAPDLHRHIRQAPYQIFTKGEREVELLLKKFPQAGDGWLSRRVVYADGVPELMYLHPQSNKGEALAALCAKWGVPREQVMAIGDSTNDLPMIEWAGVGVAMGWAPQSVRERADLVTAEQDPAGVAAAIRHALSAKVSPRVS